MSLAPWLVLIILSNVLLTLIVQQVMYRKRYNAITTKKTSLKDIAHRHQLDELLPETVASSNNFKNQFELPVLFYVVALLNLYLNFVGWPEVILSALFVLSRCRHAWVQCTTNRVKHRFMAYIAGTFIFYAMFVLLVVKYLMSLFL